MIIFPAIDIKDKRCVRLKQGRFDEATIYSKEPLTVAKQWEKQGAKYLHVVDLDGAKDGKSRNLSTIKDIVNGINIPVQLGGGIRERETVDMLLDLGIDRVILGTLAVKNKKLLRELVKQYKEKIVVSIDAKDGLVATNGWLNISQIKSIDLIKELENIGVKTIVYTDISKDGMMEGPNFKIYKDLMNNCSLNIIASGGVSSEGDLKKLRDIGLYGCIIGKALYSGVVDLKEVIEC